MIPQQKQSRENMLKQRKKYRDANKERLAAEWNEWYEKNKDSKYQVLRRKEFYKKNKEILNKNKKIWYEKNTEHLKKYRINRRKLNAEQERNRNKLNPQYRLANLLRNRLFVALRDFSKNGKVKSSNKYGIDYELIFEYIGPKPNNIEVWHIDHIKPLVSFNLNDDEQVKLAFTPENHQWLTATQNLSKGSKIL